MSDTLQAYNSHVPTCFDSHIEVVEREDWLLVPVSQTRDSGPLDKSNFESALKSLGGEGDNVEVHRFGHWGPGWYEIIIVRPGTKEASEAESIAASLADYPVLDEMDLSAREWEDFTESWSNYGAREFRRELEKAFPITECVKEENQEYAERLLEDCPDDLLFQFYNDKSSNPYEMDSDGVCICVESTVKCDIDAEDFKDLLNNLHAACVLDYCNGYQW